MYSRLSPPVNTGYTQPQQFCQAEPQSNYSLPDTFVKRLNFYHELHE